MTNLVKKAADELIRVHWDGQGCSTHHVSACSNCSGPTPMDADEVAMTVINTVGNDLREEGAEAERALNQTSWEQWQTMAEQNVAHDVEHLHTEVAVWKQSSHTAEKRWVEEVYARAEAELKNKAILTALRSFLEKAESSANTWGACSHEWLKLEELRNIVDTYGKDADEHPTT